jgi:hypothetical protein
MPESIIIGLPFTLLLSVSATSPEWAQSPPLVTLTSFHFEATYIDAVKMSKATIPGPIASRYGRNDICAGKRQLDIRLSSEPVHVGQLLSFRLAQVDHHVASLFVNLVPTFKTRRMERTYNLEMKLAVKLDGKTYYASKDITDVKVVSPEYAPWHHRIATDRVNAIAKGSS